MMVTVGRPEGGKWPVLLPSGIRVWSDTNREAWALADRLNGELANRSEETADWLTKHTAMKE